MKAVKKKKFKCLFVSDTSYGSHLFQRAARSFLWRNSKYSLLWSMWHIFLWVQRSYPSEGLVCAGVYSWPLSPVCWACLHTGTVLPASTLCSDTASERRVRQGPSTVALPFRGQTGMAESWDTRPPSSGQRDCPQVGGPPQGCRAASSASLRGSTEWCGTPLDWRWSPLSPGCLADIQTDAGGSLTGGEHNTGKHHWQCFLCFNLQHQSYILMFFHQSH